MARAWITTLVFVTFSVYSFGVMGELGLLSVFDVAFAGGWSTQVFVDLCIAITVSIAWMRNDAQRHNLVWWPFAVSALALGSIAVLAYATWSAWVAARQPALSAQS